MAIAVERYEAGDLLGAQEMLQNWVSIIVASDDHRTRRLVALVKQVD